MANENANYFINSKVDIQRTKFIENFILIWLDKNINEIPNECRHTVEIFQLFLNTIKLFSNQEQFNHFIQQIKDENLFIIVSNTFGPKIISDIETNTSIHSVYIYCYEKEYDETWTKNIRKIKGVYTDIRSIHDAIRRDIRQANNDFMPISIFSTKNSNQSFACSLLLKEILINYQSKEQEKNKLIEFARFHYNENFSQLNFIDQYANMNYDQISPIEWYTRECFIYSMINRALKLYDMEILNKIAFFIRDLHQQIKYLHSKSLNNNKILVYYGQGISHDQFNQLSLNIDGLISFNNFLWTTIDKEISFHYALQSENDFHLTPVLFQIEIDCSKTLFPFVKLDEFDYFHDTDQHILFSLNSIFRIHQIERLENRLWQINLVSIDNTDNQFKNLIDTIQDEYRKFNGFSSLGHRMFNMNDLSRAKTLFEVLLKNTGHNERKELVSIHRMLGRISQKMEDFTSALRHYRQSLTIQMSRLSSKHPSLSPDYAAVGAILQRQNNYEEARKYFQNALNNNLQSSKIDLLTTTIYYINLGRIFHRINNNSEALKNFQLALQYQEQARKQDHLLDEIRHYLTVLS